MMKIPRIYEDRMAAATGMPLRAHGSTWTVGPAALFLGGKTMCWIRWQRRAFLQNAASGRLSKLCSSGLMQRKEKKRSDRMFWSLWNSSILQACYSVPPKSLCSIPVFQTHKQCLFVFPVEIPWTKWGLSLTDKGHFLMEQMGRNRYDDFYFCHAVVGVG